MPQALAYDKGETGHAADLPRSADSVILAETLRIGFADPSLKTADTFHKWRRKEMAPQDRKPSPLSRDVPAPRPGTAIP